MVDSQQERDARISIAKVYNKGCVNCTLLSYKIVHSYATKLYTLVDRKLNVNFLVNNVNENHGTRRQIGQMTTDLSILFIGNQGKRKSDPLSSFYPPHPCANKKHKAISLMSIHKEIFLLAFCLLNILGWVQNIVSASDVL